MKVGIIGPIKYLGSFKSGISYCYASLLTNKKYLTFFSKSREETLLEDSPHLPRVPNLDRLQEGIRLLRPGYVVLPSVDYSVGKTIDLSTQVLKTVKGVKFVGVLQGYDLDSLAECYKFFKSNCDIIALPSPLETVARREEVVRDLRITQELLWIEVYKDPFEEIPPLNAMGICTSFPLRLAQVNKRLSEFSQRPKTPVVLNFSADYLVEELMSENVKLYLQAVLG